MMIAYLSAPHYFAQNGTNYVCKKSKNAKALFGALTSGRQQSWREERMGSELKILVLQLGKIGGRRGRRLALQRIIDKVAAVEPLGDDALLGGRSPRRFPDFRPAGSRRSGDQLWFETACSALSSSVVLGSVLPFWRRNGEMPHILSYYNLLRVEFPLFFPCPSTLSRRSSPSSAAAPAAESSSTVPNSGQTWLWTGLP